MAGAQQVFVREWMEMHRPARKRAVIAEVSCEHGSEGQWLEEGHA